MTMTLLFEILCIALSYSGYCRLVLTRVDTRLDVRASVYALTVAGLAAVYAVEFTEYEPTWVGVLMVGSMLAVQASTARLWRDGVPYYFRKGGAQ